ncbi:hypothetical protein [Actinoplanes aureus]|uniref:Uncharacterized protein n=1 Tax=Actinoplanes aureus TaxID=2792083 RepID=A0A931BZ09_9ACTN|nr:hypothetical protein [Actinoplanes aureus]MBG0560165.1 hypothetical protein [Actinoplanes aureus]
MTDHEQQPPATEEGAAAAPARRGKRRRLALIGTGAAAVVLAGGALLAAQSSDSQQSLPEPAAMAPLSTATPMAPVSAAVAAASLEAVASSAPASPASSAGLVSSASASPAPKMEERKQASRSEEKTSAEVRRKIKEARAKAAADGVPLKRPLKQAAAGEAAVSERTVQTKNGTIRVTTARDDLTGQRALAIAADKGERVGSANCTNRIRFSAGVPARERPSLLLCWRTSAQRSVVTMAVTPNGKPKAAESVAIIDKEWAKLG